MTTYQLMIATLRNLARLVVQIDRKDRDLAGQLRRAAASMPLNYSEAMHHKGGHRIERLHTAIGSTRETRACLDVAVALGYLDEAVVASAIEQLDRIAGSLWVTIHRPKAA